MKSIFPILILVDSILSKWKCYKKSIKILIFFSNNIGKVYIYFFGTIVKEKSLASIIFNFNFGMKITVVQKLYNL